MRPAAANTRSPLPSPTEEKREQFRSAFFHVAPSMFLGALDQTIIAAALPAIAGSLRGLCYLAWVVNWAGAIEGVRYQMGGIKWACDAASRTDQCELRERGTQVMIDLADRIRAPNRAEDHSGTRRLVQTSRSMPCFAIGCGAAAPLYNHVGIKCFVVPPIVGSLPLIGRLIGRSRPGTQS